VQFSTLVDLAVYVTTVAGATHRVGELMEALRQCPEKAQPEVPSVNTSPEIRGLATILYLVKLLFNVLVCKLEPTLRLLNLQLQRQRCNSNPTTFEFTATAPAL
jgi:hypothetical protein